MKIGIDTLGCDHSKSGNGSYLLNFIKNLSVDDDIQFELFGLESDRYTYKSEIEIPYVSVDVSDSEKAQFKWHKRKINNFVKKQGYEVVLFPAADKVLPSKCKNYLGIPVVNSLIFKKDENNKNSALHYIKKGLNNSEKIIAASELIKTDLVKNGINKNKIKVIYNGIDHKLFFPTIDDGSEFVEVKPFAIRKPYFIYGSRISGPDKKHLELMKAFEKFKKETGEPHRLVISGYEDDYAKIIHEAAFESEYSSDIFLTGYFPHENFAKMYEGAAACIFPAINEGVGLPILEAMASGIPILCSDSSSLKEAGGETPIYFNSDNINEIADCMKKIVSDKELVQKMIEKGIKRSQEFSWDKTIKETIDYIK